jgi:hypothetical protein
MEQCLSRRVIVAILFASLALSLMISDIARAQVAPGYRCASMAVAEARQYVERLIKEEKIPRPAMAPFGWEFAATVLDAKGVRIGDSDYVLFAGAKPDHVTIYPTGNLPQLVPRVSGQGERDQMFILNGVIFTTRDLTVTDALVISREGDLQSGSWRPARAVIPKGGYLWYLGRVGALLEHSRMLLALNEPLPTPVGSDKTPHLYSVGLEVVPGCGGIRLRVAGQDINLR